MRRVAAGMRDGAGLRAFDDGAEFLLERSVADGAADESGLAHLCDRQAAGSAALRLARRGGARLREQFADHERRALRGRQDESPLLRMLGAEVHLRLKTVLDDDLMHDGGIWATVAGAFHQGDSSGSVWQHLAASRSE